MRRRFELPADEVSDEEMVKLRTFLVGVQIVVGFVSHEPRVNVLAAVGTTSSGAHTWRRAIRGCRLRSRIVRPTRC